jgi:hypothetical protein
MMIESNLVGGRQTHMPGRALRYGQSITDGCIDWDTTVKVLAGDAGAGGDAAPKDRAICALNFPIRVSNRIAADADQRKLAPLRPDRKLWIMKSQ